ncbi:glycosyltransferase [Microbacterium caowuchunii]|uniref:glycosyltransferase n=1 Tax=Microbacterium caowuchunii TaxID=2614638 RepID=UPI00177E56AC|nr:glycosyltransferase [Microbacterium caowuchunii]
MSRPRVTAIITAYRPTPAVLDVIESLRPQVTSVIVVDDGSGPTSEATLRRAEEHGATVLRMGENSGIAAALNAGIRAATAADADFVVTFDQDSVPGRDFIDSLLDAHDAAVRSGRIPGPVVPEYFADVSQVHHRAADGTLIGRHAIQSGMLLAADVFDTVGVMREDFFIDLVDTEFEMRCAAAGLPTVAAPGLRMGHSLGRRYRRPIPLPGLPPLVTLSTPFRYYYRVRNRIVLNRTYWRSHAAWILRDTLLEVVHFVNALALARPRRSLWAVYSAAVSDARRMRMGPMPAAIRTLASKISWAAAPSE